MKCPYCNHKETKVTNKRDSADITRRRRECIKCGKRFTTYEKIEQNALVVVKKDGRREPFKQEKLLAGLIKACEKRPVSREIIENAAVEIENKLRKKGKEIQSREIGEIVMKSLKKIDKIAYIRFASVYRDFQDLSDFKKEIKEVGE